MRATSMQTFRRMVWTTHRCAVSAVAKLGGLNVGSGCLMRCSRLAVSLLSLLLGSQLAGCGGGGGGSGGGGKLSLTFSPARLEAAIVGGQPYVFYVQASVQGTIEGAVYVVVEDADGVIEPQVPVMQQSLREYVATITVRDDLEAGEHRGSLRVRLCGDLSCVQQYEQTTLPYVLQISNPVPVVTDVNARTAAAGCGAFTIAVIGSKFVPGSEVSWNGSARQTTYQSSTLLHARISAADIAAPGTATVSVRNAAPGGGISGGAAFSITAEAQPATMYTQAVHGDARNSGRVSTACPLSVPGAPLWTISGFPSAPPLIVDGRVFLAGQLLVPGGGQENVSARDAESGALLWYTPALQSPHIAYDDGRVYVVFSRPSSQANGAAKALDAATGAVDWDVDIGGYFFAAPVAADGVLAVTGNGPGTSLQTLAQGNGEVLWSKFIGGVSPPAIGDGSVYLCGAQAFDLATGAVRWENFHGGNCGSDRDFPVLDGSRVYTPRLYQQAIISPGGLLLDAASGQAIRTLEGLTRAPAIGESVGYFPESDTLVARRLTDFSELWRSVKQSSSSPLLVNDSTVLMSADDGRIYALDAQTGAALWSVSGGVYFSLGDGYLAAVQANNSLSVFRVAAPAP